MLRKLAALFLVFIIGITSFPTPAFASGEFSEKEPFAIELAKASVKEVVIFLTPPAVCFAADAIATTFFPPAAALAPYCATFGLPSGAAGAIASGFKDMSPAMAQ